LQERGDRITHLQMVQEVIKRQAQCSFVIKGWSITLVTLIFAIVYSAGINPQLTLFAILPAALFWYLDIIYVRQERLFRHLHDAIAQDIRENTAKVKLFDIKPYNYKNEKDVRWRNVALSKTVLPVPLIAIGLSLLISFVISK
jgi:hypothetical protein